MKIKTKAGDENAQREDAQVSVCEQCHTLNCIINTLPDVVWSVAIPSRQILYVNPAVREVFGVEPEDVTRKPILWGELVFEEDRPLVMAAWDKGLRADSFRAEYRTHGPAGEVRWVQSRGRPVKDAAGKAIRMDGVSRDVTELRAQERKIARLYHISALLSGISACVSRAKSREELLRESCRIAAEEGGFGIAWIGILDRKVGKIRGIAHYGFEPGAPVDFDLPGVGSPDDEYNTVFRALLEKRPVFANEITAGSSRDSARQMALRAGYHSVISLPLLVDSDVVGVMVLFALHPGYFDATEVKLLSEFSRSIGVALTHLDREERLTYLAQYDVLTGLPNRVLFHERVASLLDATRGSGVRTALVIADVTRFHSINETFGHVAGDAVLCELAQRLRRAWPEAEGVARMSADSFALVMSISGQGQEALDINAVTERCLDTALSGPFRVLGNEIRVSMTAGVAVAPAGASNADELFHNAEAAQRRALENGERTISYRREMNAQVAETLLLEYKLRGALERDEFELHYQPKRAAVGERVTGLEALIRWRDPQTGIVAPGSFVPILEETGMILEVGSWAMQRALEQSQGLQTADGKPLRVAVNVSPIQLRQRDFVRIVRGVIERVRGAARLELEITESTIMDDLEDNVKKLAAVRNMGVNIAVDDFGTGYSSLAYLAKLPVNSLKIDRSFVSTMTSNAHSMTLVNTIISLAHALDLKVIAEGVETDEQAKQLRLLTCDELQGYLISRPMPIEEVHGYLARTQRSSD
jgi:diguanylate cyclase (GGDEF)-like protein/PAS domain S-box-containing protein